MGNPGRPSQQRRKVEYQCAWDIVSEMHPGEFIRKSVFEALAYPLRRATKAAGMKLTSGRVLSGNNHIECRRLFFPRNLTKYCTDDGNIFTLWEDTIALRVEYTKTVVGSVGYSIQKIKRIPNTNKSDIQDKIRKKIRDNTGKKKIREAMLDKFSGMLINAYQDELLKIAAVKQNPYDYAVNGSESDNHVYNFTGGGHYDGLFTVDFDEGKNVAYREFPWTGIESLLFASTIFSLCKPLFRRCKIKGADPQFALHIDLKGCHIPSGDGKQLYVIAKDGEKTDDPTEIQKAYHYYWALNGFIHLWCDFDIMEEYRLPEKESGDHIAMLRSFREFRRSWNDHTPTASWQNLYFPLIYSNYQGSQWDNEIKLYEDIPLYPKVKLHPSRVWMRDIGQISCLPIVLLLPSPQKPYSEDDCLRVEWEFPPDTDFGKIEKRMPSLYSHGHEEHERIKSIYYKFLQLIHGKEYGEVKKSLKKSYHDALHTIGASLKAPTSNQQHMACILGSLYFARNTFREAGIKDTNTQFKGHIRQVEKFFCHQVTTADFSRFLAEARGEDSPYHKAVLLQDEDGIYLSWKDYWHYFEDYCKEHNVVLACTELQFRKRHLVQGGYLKPQSEQHNPNKYLRYDYKKMINNKKETVIDVSPRILDLIH